MADAGRILIIPRGDYNANSTYDKLDLVKYKGTSWLAKKNATGVEPVEGEYWQKIFDLGTANNLTTTAEGFALDARQGKTLDDKITATERKLDSHIYKCYTIESDDTTTNGLFINPDADFIFIQASNGSTVYRLQLGRNGTLRLYNSTDGGTSFLYRDI